MFNYLEAHTLPLFLRYLIFEMTGHIRETRYLNKGLGYDPLGNVLGSRSASGAIAFSGTLGCSEPMT